jgi:hypothetical protein
MLVHRGREVTYLDSFIREIERMLWAVVNSMSSLQFKEGGIMGSRFDCANAELAHVSSCCIRS